MHYLLEAQAATDRGLTRAENQDAFLVALPQSLFVVADGMGGHAGGEIASSLCVQEILQTVEKQQAEASLAPSGAPPHQTYLQNLTLAINAASTKIYERALEEPALRGMGTTATVLMIQGAYGYCAHVGDSRLYLIRSGFIYQMTNDHSLVSEQVAAGVLSPEEARHHQLRNVITRSVGYQEEELVDTLAIPLHDGDFFLLCSDGLHGKLSDQEIASLATQSEAGGVAALVALANQRGGEDNITVVIVQVTRGPAPSQGASHA